MLFRSFIKLSFWRLKRTVFIYYLFCMETGSHYVAQAGLELLGSSDPRSEERRVGKECRL